MAEYIIVVVLVLLCIGQIVAVYKGRVVAVTYYICVAPINYFNVWNHGSWDTARICGAILIVGLAVRGASGRGALRSASGPFVALTAWGVLVTLVGQFYWPFEAMASGSLIYDRLRPVIQILNWLITIGVGWQIARAFSEPGALNKARTTILVVAFLLCGYALYQFVAMQVGLPVTGIRRPFETPLRDVVLEEFASYDLAGQPVFRPGSLIGEPKGLGAMCVLWVALILGAYVENKARQDMTVILPVILVALGLTASTAAWAGCGGTVAVAYFIFFRRREKGLGAALRLPLLLVLLTIVLGSVFRWDIVKSTALQIFEARVTNRMDDPVGDLPEKMAIQVLEDRPVLILTGTGLGGVSFYIAKDLGEKQSLILFPNNGLLGFICDIGLIGLGVIGLLAWRGFRVIFGASGESNNRSVLALVGVATLGQCLVFGSPVQFSIAIGCLSAAHELVEHAEVAECGSAADGGTGTGRAT